jgi:hypothetical protein
MSAFVRSCPTSFVGFLGGLLLKPQRGWCRAEADGRAAGVALTLTAAAALAVADCAKSSGSAARPCMRLAPASALRVAGAARRARAAMGTEGLTDWPRQILTQIPLEQRNAWDRLRRAHEAGARSCAALPLSRVLPVCSLCPVCCPSCSVRARRAATGRECAVKSAGQQRQRKAPEATRQHTHPHNNAAQPKHTQTQTQTQPTLAFQPTLALFHPYQDVVQPPSPLRRRYQQARTRVRRPHNAQQLSLQRERN